MTDSSRGRKRWSGPLRLVFGALENLGVFGDGETWQWFADVLIEQKKLSWDLFQPGRPYIGSDVTAIDRTKVYDGHGSAELFQARPVKSRLNSTRRPSKHVTFGDRRQLLATDNTQIPIRVGVIELIVKTQ